MIVSKCKKCDSNDLVTKYVKDGELITSSSEVGIDDEFLKSSEYDFYFKITAKKEHLHKYCRNCQYSWNENTKNNQG